jgi:hypothetical protein
VVDGKVHLYADEGPGWFLDLFYVEKGADRFPPLAADDHEALAALAEAAGIVEPDGQKRFDVALAEFAKAEAAEPARAERLKARRALVEAEKAAKLLMEEHYKKLEDTNASLTELVDQLGGSLNDAKKFDDAKKKIAAAEAGWRDAVKVAAQDLNDVLGKFPSTIVRGLLATTVPDDALYGVEIPPAPKRASAPPAPPPPTPSGPAPGMPPRPNDIVPPPNAPTPGMDAAPGAGMDATPPMPGKDPLPPAKDVPAKDVPAMDGRPK